MEKLKTIRQIWNKFMLKTNNIDRLMTDKIEDFILIQEQPIPIQIKNVTGIEDGKDRVLFIGNFNFDNEHKFFHQWAKIISLLSAKIINMGLLESRRKDLLKKASFDMLANGKWMLEFLLMDKWLKKQMCKLIGKTLLKQQAYIMNERGVREKESWQNCSYRFFRKNITKELLIQICWLIYIYNFDSQKKSLRFVAEKIELQQLEQTYIPFWLQNLGGLTGKFGNAQVENIDYYCSDLESEDSKNSEMGQTFSKR